MKQILLYLLLCFPFLACSADDGGRTVINLNGTWQFDQTVNAFPPAKFTRTIPVSVILPNEAGGYVLVTEFTPEKGKPVISRRFIRVGKLAEYSFTN